MTIHVITNLPELLNEFGEVIRLFDPEVSVSLSEGEVSLEHEHAVEDGQFIERWALGGERYVHAQAVALDGVSELARKRLIKRASKTGLYNLMRQKTGQHPPWGSLTGIRPTRLMYEALEDGLSPDEAEARMEHLFDVSAERSQLLTDILSMQRGLIEHGEDVFDLYIGIPFCTTRCTYCSFSSGTIGNGKLVEPYLTALLSEMAQCADLMKTRGMKIRAAYMGGGTPTSLSAAQLDRVLSEAMRLFPGAVEWTVEAGRPDTIDEGKLHVLKAHRIDRISINPQSFSDETLRLIGRAHTAADTLRAFALAREMGFSHINMDLIAALPGEDEADFGRSLEKAMALGAESITVHTLAIKHGSKLNELGYAPTDAESAARMVDLGRVQLMGASYRPYYLYRQKYMAGNLENVGYAKPGCACLYNIDIMEETANVLAVGAGAITKWLFPGERRIERAPNLKNIEQYIERMDEMVQRKLKLISK